MYGTFSPATVVSDLLPPTPTLLSASVSRASGALPHPRLNTRTQSHNNRRRGRVVKGMGHLDHVCSYSVREVESSIPDWGNIEEFVIRPR